VTARGLFRKIALAGLTALSLLSTIGAALAQPAPVPALPDAERRTAYSISASACSCSIGFALFGDSTDFANWVEVFLNGVRVDYNDATYGWTITSPSGSLATLPRPISNAVLTFNSAQTGTVQIIGARRPRRTSQFGENAGVSARNLNQAFTDIIAQNRELWDKANDVTGRAVLAPPGETLALLPVLASRQNKGACFDNGGSLPHAFRYRRAHSRPAGHPAHRCPSDHHQHGPSDNCQWTAFCKCERCTGRARRHCGDDVA
jgi:hypothetical protein